MKLKCLPLGPNAEGLEMESMVVEVDDCEDDVVMFEFGIESVDWDVHVNDDWDVVGGDVDGGVGGDVMVMEESDDEASVVREGEALEASFGA